jgi:hypothetical protein
VGGRFCSRTRPANVACTVWAFDVVMTARITTGLFTATSATEKPMVNGEFTTVPRKRLVAPATSRKKSTRAMVATSVPVFRTSTKLVM